jgi:hypothetical protein
MTGFAAKVAKTNAAQTVGAASEGHRLDRAPALAPLLQRKCACNSSTDGGQDCDECQSQGSARLQAKRRACLPTDAFEQEADRAAEAAVSGRSVQDLSVGGFRVATDSASRTDLSTVEQTVASCGQPLDPSTRALMESSFGHDFSRVRIHHDVRAAESARAVDAHAYTVGQHIAFDAGKYVPDTIQGRRLLAHELAHTVQQAGPRSAPLAALQRSPKLEITAAEECKAFTREFTGVINAKSVRGVPRVYYQDPAPKGVLGQLETGDEVTAGKMDKKAPFWRPVCAQREDMPAQIMWVLKDYIDVKPAPRPEPKAEPEDEAEPPAKRKKRNPVRERIEALPASVRFKGLGKGRTHSAINMAIAAKDFWYNEPVDRKLSRRIHEVLIRKFVDVHLTDSNFDKHFGHTFGRGMRYQMLFQAGRGALPMIESKIKSGQIHPGGGEASWKHHLSEFMVAHEVMEVLAGDLDIKEAKQIQAVETLMGGKGLSAFFEGLLSGLNKGLSADDYKTLAGKIAKAQALNIVVPIVVLSGALVGIAKDLGEALKGIYELVTEPVEMAKNMAQVIEILLFDEEGSRVLGEAMGAESAKDVLKLADEPNIVAFTYELGKLVGPTVVYTVLSFVTGGAAGAARVSKVLHEFLKKFPKVAKQVDRIRDLLPSKKAKPDLPERPDAAPEGGRRKTPSKKGKPVPGLGGCRGGSLFCPLDYVREEFAGLFRQRAKAPFASYIRDYPDVDLEMGRSLRRNQTILTGNEMYAAFLREVPDSEWAEPFKDALTAAKRLDIDYREISVGGRRYRWPLQNGTPWVVHHDPPLGWIKFEHSDWWHPMPPSMHDDAHKWWRKLERRIKNRIDPDRRREYLEEDVDIREL